MANPNIVSVATIKGVNCGFNLSATATSTLFTVDTGKLVKINSIICANVDGTNAATLDLFCLLYTSPSPRDGLLSRMPSSA